MSLNNTALQIYECIYFENIYTFAWVCHTTAHSCWLSTHQMHIYIWTYERVCGVCTFCSYLIPLHKTYECYSNWLTGCAYFCCLWHARISIWSISYTQYSERERLVLLVFICACLVSAGDLFSIARKSSKYCEREKHEIEVIERNASMGNWR